MVYERIDSKELAKRLNIPETWVRDNVRSRAEDPIPCVRFGRYVRFEWGSPELEEWLERRRVSNRKNGGESKKEVKQ